jgi:hypothetical protein
MPNRRWRRGRDTDVRQQKIEEGDATSDLLLKHLDATLVTYVGRQMKHLNMHMKHLLQHQIYF